MNRRVFLQSLALGASPLLKTSAAATSVPTDELLGLKRPELYGDNFNLRKEAADAFNALRADARQAGIQIYSQSSYRGFDHQRRIWNNRYSGFRQQNMSPREAIQRTLRYNSLPGGSRHHWGTDLDMIDLAPQHSGALLAPANYAEGGVFRTLYEWLIQNAIEYDYHLVYTDEENRPGFLYEPWHWSYAPLSIDILRQYLSLDLAQEIPRDGLEGAEYLDEVFFHRYRNEWKLGINPTLIPAEYAEPTLSVDQAG